MNWQERRQKKYEEYIEGLKKMSPKEALDLLEERYSGALERESWTLDEPDYIALEILRKALK